MFAMKKLVLIAACVALSLGPSIAKLETSHLRIRICGGEDITAASASDSAGDEIATPNLHADNHDSGKTDSTSHPDEDSDDKIDVTILVDELCTGKGESPMSVEGVEGVFCVTGQPCVADIADGACPDPQVGLEFGASCGQVIAGVYGCKPNGAPEDEEEDDSLEPIDISLLCAGEGRSQMSVEGVTGIFCVTGPACVADNADGACPGPQEGLPNGSECGKVVTGVYGCKPTAVTRLRHKKHSFKSYTRTVTKAKMTKHQHKKTHHTKKNANKH